MLARLDAGGRAWVWPLAHRLALWALLAGSFLLKLNNLNHAAIKPLDEVFHAIVAQNFLRHPLTPTLVDQPFLPYDRADWQSNHIWLHKPPMAMWQMAISLAALGGNNFALRLPSAVLSTLAVWLTYLIGAELLDATAGLIAAALQAFNPVILMLVNGYVFSDHVDISLLFWTEAAIYFLVRAMRSGGKTDCILCGVAQGFAFLSKSYPALIVTLLALAAWRMKSRVSGRRVILILLVTAAVVLPWILNVAVRFPTEFAAENAGILRHLDQNVEGWAAPWDRVLFDYWVSIFHVFYPCVLAAAILLLPKAARHDGLWMVFVWALGVLVPNLLATSKTMSATLIGWPAMWLLMGCLISQALRGDNWALGVWLASMLSAAFLLSSRSIPTQGWGYDSGGFASIMRAHLWVVWQVLGSIVIGWLFAKFAARLARPAAIAAAAATLLLAVRWWSGDHPRGYAVVAWEVTEIDSQRPGFAALGAFNRRLPPNAAFIVDEREKLENKLIEYVSLRSCYALGDHSWMELAAELDHAGALPYFISPDAQPLPAVFVDRLENRTLYACTPQARAAADELAGR